jgi:hypothetical protein
MNRIDQRIRCTKWLVLGLRNIVWLAEGSLGDWESDPARAKAGMTKREIWATRRALRYRPWRASARISPGRLDPLQK